MNEWGEGCAFRDRKMKMEWGGEVEGGGEKER